MDTLKKEIAILIQCSDFKEIEKQLQTINKLIVTNYMFELSNGLRIYPIEVEAYFKHPKFNGLCMEMNCKRIIMENFMFIVQA